MGEPRVLREKHLKLKLRRYGSAGAGALARGLDALGWRMAHRLEAEPLTGGERWTCSSALSRTHTRILAADCSWCFPISGGRGGERGVGRGIGAVAAG